MQSLLHLTYSCRRCRTGTSILSHASTLRSRSTTSAIRAGVRAEASARTRSRYDGRSSNVIENAGVRSSSGIRDGRDRERPPRRFDSRDGGPRFGSASPRFGAAVRRADANRDDTPRFGSPARRSGSTDYDSPRFGATIRRSTSKDDDGPQFGAAARRSRDPSSTEESFDTAPRYAFANGRQGSESQTSTGKRGSNTGRGRLNFDNVPQQARPTATDANGFPVSRRERRAAFWEQKQAEDAEAEIDEEYDLNGSENEAVATAHQARPHSGRRGSNLSDSRRRSTRTGTPIPRSKSGLDDHDKVPTAIKYTTAASQFLYGANVVIAALASNRRKIYHLYMHKRAEAENIAQIRRAATAQDIPITRTTDTDLMDRLSQGRPHNGVVLETSPLPASPVTTLSHVSKTSRRLRFVCGPQSAEEKAVNGKNSSIALPAGRAPVVVFLDGITDPGNLGSIIRSAHFFGVDAVAVATQTCASLDSPIVAKASSGACEAMPLLRVAKAGSFVKQSADHGWTVCAAVAPEDPGRTITDDDTAATDEAADIAFGAATDGATDDAVEELSTDSTSGGEVLQQLRDTGRVKAQQRMDTSQMLRDNLLADQPRLLLLGAEGEGLRRYLKERADVLLTISSGPKVASKHDVGVDSMNVGVAAGILMNAMVSVHSQAKKPSSAVREEEDTVETSSENVNDITEEVEQRRTSEQAY